MWTQAWTEANFWSVSMRRNRNIARSRRRKGRGEVSARLLSQRHPQCRSFSSLGNLSGGNTIMSDVHAPSLRELATRSLLPLRDEPYWNILEYGRHIGLRKRHPDVLYWLARTRMKSGLYKQQTLGVATTGTFSGLSFHEATREARIWFETIASSGELSEPSPVGGTTHLRYLT